MMKKYHEVGIVREDGKVTGIFLREGEILGDSLPFFTPYSKLVNLVKRDEVELPEVAIHAILEDSSEEFYESMKFDAIYNCNGDAKLIPVAVLSVIKGLFTKSVVMVIPVSNEIEQMFLQLCESNPEIRSLFQINHGIVTIVVSVKLLEELLDRMRSLGCNFVCCTETARSALENGIPFDLLPHFTRLAPESVLQTVESIVIRSNYKSYKASIVTGSL